jgi:DNA-directed RNA polymerase subunit M/transcription elongation factor TFIIS
VFRCCDAAPWRGISLREARIRACGVLTPRRGAPRALSYSKAMSAATKKRGRFAIARTYKPAAQPPQPVAEAEAEEAGPDAEAEEAAEHAAEEAIVEAAEEEAVQAEEAQAEEEEEEELGRVRRRPRPVAVREEGPSVQSVLLNIAVQALGVGSADELPEFVLRLTWRVGLDDADVFWEFSSMTDAELGDYYRAIDDELVQRDKEGIGRAGVKLPHYHSLTFASPLLVEQRRLDDERDGQLLRKDKPVRGAVSCPKCHDNLISTRQIQLRGLDEPSTNIYTCFTCSNMWSV